MPDVRTIRSSQADQNIQGRLAEKTKNPMESNELAIKDLVDIFSDLPDERMEDRDYAHDPLDDVDGDCWSRFNEDWERED